MSDSTHSTAAGGPSATPAPLPEELAARAKRRLDALREQTRSAREDNLDPTVLPGDWARVWACSDFVARSCTRNPTLLQDLLATGDLQRRYERDAYRGKAEAVVADAQDESALMRALRRARRREMIRIAWRDIGGCAGLEETVRDTSALADALIDQVLERLYAWGCRDLGEPRGSGGEAQHMVVLALGKLGAEELNFSSDIDLLFTFPESGQTAGGRRTLSNEEFFLHLGRQLIRVLDRSTEDGFVFRVDMRLRPFGASGPLVSSFNALEDYYQFHGRDWERYALIRARPIAGDISRGEQLLERLRPFMYRRYLDFGALESLRDMKQLIAQEVRRKGLADNIKLGPGGIREIEFVGQAFQMVRGGREADLRGRRLLQVLERLGEKGHLPSHAVAELSAAYRFLRTCEHRLQQMDDRQTHTLPGEPGARARLAAGMGFAGWAALARTLADYRTRVQAQFDQVFGAPQAEPAEAPGELDTLWEGSIDREHAAAVLAQSGYADGAAAWGQLDKLRHSYAVRTLGKRGRTRLQRLVPLLLAAAAAQDNPLATLQRLLLVVESIARRSVYLALLVERPLALSQLVQLCAASPRIAHEIARHAVLLDEFLDPRQLYAPLDKTALEADLDARLAAMAAGDSEAEMDALRQFKHANVLRVAAADVADTIPLMVVSDHLTAIAEVALAGVLHLAWRDLSSRYGIPRCAMAGARREAPFIVVGYGKLGGLELGYGSDLDLVFLHGSAGGEQRTEGPRVVDNAVFFGRLGQRIIHYLTVRTPAGILYPVDPRLRPSGASGLLVSGIDAFDEYQRCQAWTWEHQALVRARPVAGDPGLARRFRDIRREVLLAPRDAERLRTDVCAMRERMRERLGSGPAQGFHIKQDPGGIADIEFMVQYATLRWARRLGDHLDFTDNIRLLEGFAKVGLMAEGDVRLLTDAYRAYRARIHALALQEQPELVGDEEFREPRAEVVRIWRQLMQG